MLIYKIISKNSDLVYVGGTDQTLKLRFSGHQTSYKCWLEGKPRSYYSSYKVLECGDCSIEMLEETEDDTREQFWVRELDACNENTLDFDKVAYQKKYYTANREALLEYGKAYYAANRVTAIEKSREWGSKKIACLNCGAIIRRDSMAKHKKRKICMEHSNSDLSD
tara:strand:- start:306 stop:803 length:498 start_codon:yes stop_codon:yes gene_type:complete